MVRFPLCSNCGGTTLRGDSRPGVGPGESPVLRISVHPFFPSTPSWPPSLWGPRMPGKFADDSSLRLEFCRRVDLTAIVRAMFAPGSSIPGPGDLIPGKPKIPGE